MSIPFLPPIDLFSFWLGFGVACGLFALAFVYRRQLQTLSEAALKRLRGVRELLTAGAERNLRADMVRFAQTAHMAGHLFILNDVLLEPRLLIPDNGFDPSATPPEDDLTAVIPNIPEWPELAAVYRAPTLSVQQAFANDQNIIVLGAHGAGKTSLLAHLVTLAVQAAPDDAIFPGAPTPLFIHAADLELPVAGKDDVSAPLIAAVQQRVSALVAPRVPGHVRTRLRDFKCVIFLDGLDELSPARIGDVADWVKQFQAKYPQHRWIAASLPYGFGAFTAINFAPVVIAPYSAQAYETLIEKWLTQWGKLRAGKKPSPLDVESAFLSNWLRSGNAHRSILEITLKIWAALHGDARGPRPVDFFEAALRRLGLRPYAQRALGPIAMHFVNQPDQAGVPRADLAALCDTLFKGPDGKPEIDSAAVLDELTGKRVLTKRGKDRLAFRSTTLLAFVAARTLAAEPGLAEPGNSPLWVRILYFLNPLSDITPAVAKMLTQPPDILQTDQLTLARWLRDAPAGNKWRPEVYRRLAKFMLDTNLPEALRLRALGGFIIANDPGSATLFKQTLANPDPFNRRIAALALGALGDVTATSALANLFVDPYLDVRWAAALALVAIGTEGALEMLKRGILNADDAMKQACAQALARHPDGHDILREWVTHPDLSVRRAVLFGLADIGQPWAHKLINDVLLNETEWYVRNAANELAERLKSPTHALPAPQAPQPPEKLGWLVAWAATQGLGVPPGRGAVEVLNRALHEGDEPTRIAAIDALARLGDPSAARELYGALRDPQSALVRDAAFRGLAYLSNALGQRLATPSAN